MVRRKGFGYKNTRLIGALIVTLALAITLFIEAAAFVFLTRPYRAPTASLDDPGWIINGAIKPTPYFSCLEGV